jgi:hypothetical protein
MCLNFFSVATDGTVCPGVDSASKNEYQGIPLGVKAAGEWGQRPPTLRSAERQENPGP